jgi:hypothetical protein
VRRREQQRHGRAYRAGKHHRVLETQPLVGQVGPGGAGNERRQRRRGEDDADRRGVESALEEIEGNEGQERRIGSTDKDEGHIEVANRRSGTVPRR